MRASPYEKRDNRTCNAARKGHSLETRADTLPFLVAETTEMSKEEIMKGSGPDQDMLVDSPLSMGAELNSITEEYPLRKYSEGIADANEEYDLSTETSRKPTEDTKRKRGTAKASPILSDIENKKRSVPNRQIKALLNRILEKAREIDQNVDKCSKMKAEVKRTLKSKITDITDIAEEIALRNSEDRKYSELERKIDLLVIENAHLKAKVNALEKKSPKLSPRSDRELAEGRGQPSIITMGEARLAAASHAPIKPRCENLNEAQVAEVI